MNVKTFKCEKKCLCEVRVRSIEKESVGCELGKTWCVCVLMQNVVNV
jgi:hypothetical protein